MDISSVRTVAYSGPQSTAHTPAEATERRGLAQAVRSVNQSGVLGQNQLVLTVDRETQRRVIRIEDRETHELVLQVPAEYVLRLAQDLHIPA